MTEATQPPLTVAELDAIEARLAAASPAPWILEVPVNPGAAASGWPFEISVRDEDGHSWLIASIRTTVYSRPESENRKDETPGNAALIAAAPTDLRRLCAEVRTMWAVFGGLVSDTDALARAFERGQEEAMASLRREAVRLRDCAAEARYYGGQGDDWELEANRLDRTAAFLSRGTKP